MQVLVPFFFSVWNVGTTQAWNHVIPTFNLCDLCAFKGKIYTDDNALGLFEMRLDPNPRLILLKTKNKLKLDLCNAFERFGESFYVFHM